jgi:hypothetical protein
VEGLAAGEKHQVLLDVTGQAQPELGCPVQALLGRDAPPTSMSTHASGRFPAHP